MSLSVQDLTGFGIILKLGNPITEPISVYSLKKEYLVSRMPHALAKTWDWEEDTFLNTEYLGYFVLKLQPWPGSSSG